MTSARRNDSHNPEGGAPGISFASASGKPNRNPKLNCPRLSTGSREGGSGAPVVVCEGGVNGGVSPSNPAPAGRGPGDVNEGGVSDGGVSPGTPRVGGRGEGSVSVGGGN